MENSMKNKTGIPIKCKKCEYEWLTKSELIYVCCPRCLNKNRVPKKDIMKTFNKE